MPIIIANNLAVEVDKAVMPDFRENDRLSVGNWIVVIVGGFLNVIQTSCTARIFRWQDLAEP